MFLTVALLGLFCIGAASASCAQTIAQDDDYMTCVRGIAMLFQANPSDVTKTMCSPLGQQKMECLLEYTQTCPELVSAQTGGDGINALIAQMSSMQHMCSMVYGPCAQVSQCAGNESSQGAVPQPGSTPFALFPAMTDNVCGQLKTTFECLDGLRDPCPEQVAQMEESMKSMFRQASSTGIANMPVLNYDALPKYIKVECPKVPRGFATNTCVRQKLESRKFQDCFAKVSQNFGGQLNSCPAYLAGKKCIEGSVGACGKAEARAIVRGAPVFLSGVPSNCETAGMGDGSGKGGMGSPEPSGGSQAGSVGPSPASGNDDDDGTGGSGGIQAPIMTLIVASVSLMILFH